MGNILIRTLKVFGAGCCVYVAMAACSSDGGSSSSSGASSSSGSVGASSGSSGQSPGSPVPNAMADEWYASGSRLKVQYLEGDDGAKSFNAFFDSMRNEACTIGLHTDGSRRCMPFENVAYAGYFREAGCQLPLYYTAKGAAPAAYGVKVEGAGTRRFPLTPYTGNVYAGSPAICSDVSVTAPQTSTFYLPGDEVPASAFVGATLKVAQ